MKPLGKPAALAAALAGALGGCADPEPIRLLERAEAGLVAPVELRDETRNALSVDLGSRVELELDFPEEPFLSFAIGASSRDRPTLLVPVVFRALGIGPFGSSSKLTLLLAVDEPPGAVIRHLPPRARPARIRARTLVNRTRPASRQRCPEHK